MEIFTERSAGGLMTGSEAYKPTSLTSVESVTVVEVLVVCGCVLLLLWRSVESWCIPKGLQWCCVGGSLELFGSCSRLLYK